MFKFCSCSNSYCDRISKFLLHVKQRNTFESRNHLEESIEPLIGARIQGVKRASKIILLSCIRNPEYHT